MVKITLLVVALCLISYACADSFNPQNAGETVPLLSGNSYTISTVSQVGRKNVTLTAVPSSDYTLSPSVLNFMDTGLASFTITGTGRVPVASTVAFQVSGGDAAFFPAWLNFTKTFTMRTLTFTADAGTLFPPASLTTGVVSPSFTAKPSSPAPAGVTYSVATDPANAATLTPATGSSNTLAFGTGANPLSFFVQTSAIGSITFMFTPTGPDADLFVAVNRTVSSTLRTFSGNSFYSQMKAQVNQASQTVRISANYAPSNGVTLTPMANDVVFNPTSLAFAGVDSAQFSFTGSKLGTKVVYWMLSGPDAASYAVPMNTTIQITGYDFQFSNDGTQSYTVGQTSTTQTIFTQYAPTSDITLQITPSDCAFGTATVTPNTFKFTPTALKWTFTVTSPVTCNVAFNFTASGTDKDIYGLPSMPAIAFSKITVTPSVPATPAVKCGDTTTVTLTASSNSVNGYTVSMSAPGAVFDPSSITFSAATLIATYKVTSTYSTAISVTYRVSGTDSTLVNPLVNTNIAVGSKSITIPTASQVVTQGQNVLYAGTTSDLIHLKLSNPSTKALKVAMSASGLTITPSELNFAPGTVDLTFTVSGSVVGSYTIFYTASGDAAGCYSAPTSGTPVSIAPLGVTVFPNAFTRVDIGAKSPVYTISIPSLPADAVVTPAIVDAQGNVNPAVVFTPSTITLSAAAPSASFSYTSTSLLTNAVYSIRYTVTGNAAAFVQPVIATAPTFSLRTFKLPTSLTTATTAYPLPTFYAGIASPSQLVTLKDFPVNDVTITPTAPNTVFTPASLSFSSTTKSGSFTVQSNDGNGGKTITWVVSGTDAAYYAAPASVNFVAVQRTITVNNIGDVTADQYYVNTAIPFTLVSYQTDSNPITITPSGGFFTFSPASITLDASNSVAKFTATPTSVGTNKFSFTINGVSQSYYAPIADVVITTIKGDFELLGSAVAGGMPLSIDMPSAPIRIRAKAPPATSVTVTLSSPHVDINPSSFTFTPSSVSASFTLQPTRNYFFTYQLPSGTRTLEIDAVVTGANADQYNEFAASILVDVNTPTRQLTFSDTTLDVALNVPTYFTVSAPQAPTGTVTLSPFVKDPSFKVDPSVLTLTAAAPAGQFTVTRTGYTEQAAEMIFVVGGTDALLFSAAPTVMLNPTQAAVSFTNFPTTMTVNKPVTNAYVIISQGSSSALTVTPTVVSGPKIVFDPASYTFAAGQVSLPIKSMKASSVGASIVSFAVSGTDVDAFLSVASRTVNVGQAGITMSAAVSTLLGGVTTDTITLTLDAVVSSALNVVPAAQGWTFNPATIAFAAGDLTKTFTATASQNNLASPLTFSMSGADALNYVNPCPAIGGCTATSGNGLVTTAAVAGGALTNIVTFTFSQNYMPADLTITPTPNNQVTYQPASYTLRKGNAATAVKFVATSAVAQVGVALQYTLTGAGNAFYSFNPNTITRMTFGGYSLTINNNLVASGALNYAVGSVSVPLTLVLSSPPTQMLQTVTVTPTADRDGVTFYPSSLVIDPSNSTAISFSVKSTFVGSTVVSFPVSGAGMTQFVSNDLATVAKTTLNFVPATFDIPALTNVVSQGTLGAGNVFTWGRDSQLFTVWMRSAPVPVSLTLVSNSFDFFPATLNFDNATQAASFYMRGKAVGPAQISFNLKTDRPDLFTPPAAIGQALLNALYVQYDVEVSDIPTLKVGVQSDPITVSIKPTPASSFSLQLAGGSGAIFSPSVLVFTAAAMSRTFQITPTAVTIFVPNNINAPGGNPSVQANANLQLTMTGLDGSDVTATRYAVPQIYSTGIVVAPGSFDVRHPRYQLDVKSKVDIEISVLPRSDVTLTLFGNNLLFEPSFVTFRAGGDTKQSIDVTPLQTSSYELDYASFKVDYVLSGTNRADYMVPSESNHYFAISQGYIAAAILAPIAFIAIVVVVAIFVCKGRGGKSGGRSVGASV